MFSRRFTLVLFAAVVFPAAPVQAQGSGFHASVQQMAIERSGLVSFDASISGTAHVIADDDPLTDRIPTGFSLRMAVDVPNRRMHIARQDFFKTSSGAVSDTRLYVESDGWQLFAGAGGSAVHAYGTHPGRIPPCFDPRALGLAFCGGFKNGRPAERVFGDLFQWKDEFSRTELGDGIIGYRRGNGAQSYWLHIDEKRGCWPVSSCLIDGGKLLSRTDVSLAQNGDYWLPVAAVVTCPANRYEFAITWNSVNEPISPRLFDVPSIDADYGFKTVVQPPPKLSK